MNDGRPYSFPTRPPLPNMEHLSRPCKPYPADKMEGDRQCSRNRQSRANRQLQREPRFTSESLCQAFLCHRVRLPVLTVLVLLRREAKSPILTGRLEIGMPDGWLTNRYNHRMARLSGENPAAYFGWLRRTAGSQAVRRRADAGTLLRTMAVARYSKSRRSDRIPHEPNVRKPVGPAETGAAGCL
jgi:hypothetical protein